MRDAYEPRPWRLWADDPREAVGARHAAGEQGSFDRWQRQMRPTGPRPGWSVQAVFDWAQQGLEERGALLHAPAARCLTAVAGPDDRPSSWRPPAAAPTAPAAPLLHYLAEARDPAVLDLIEAAASSTSPLVADAAVSAFERMCGEDAVDRARGWVHRPDALGSSAGAVLAARGGVQDAPLVLGALRRAVRADGPDAASLLPLVDGAGRPASPARRPCCATSTARPPPRSCAAAPPARSPRRTPPSGPVSPSNACGTAKRPPEVAALHAETGDLRVAERLRRLASDPAEEDEVQTAVRSRIGPDAPTR